jgi:hypothetical protein
MPSCASFGPEIFRLNDQYEMLESVKITGWRVEGRHAEMLQADSLLQVQKGTLYPDEN